MKKWGLVVTLLYFLIVLILLVPATGILVADLPPSFSDITKLYQHWATWMLAGIFALCQVALLSLSVDQTRPRMRSRTPIAVSAVITGLCTATITAVVVLALYVVVRGESKVPDPGGWLNVIAVFVILWMIWGVLFYRLYRNSEDPVTRALSWLFRGSVLELLVAVPSHVIVRRRDDCCAPMVTGFGITSGIAIMLIAFGPSVLLLFKKRMERYPAAGK
ncbi:MAG TPA: hypothetical protein VMG31_15955 [Verrucomicrobiae bacterium]|nr:hypothetical protein [Verrucomicrobiae bacterium]